jgi:carbamate kinase
MAPHEARQYIEEGHFANGTMKPKIDAALQFIDNGGESVLITSIENFENALKGGTGTVVTNNQ